MYSYEQRLSPPPSFATGMTVRRPLPAGDFGPAVNEDEVEPCGFGALVVVLAVAKKDGGTLNITVCYFSGGDFGFCIGAAKNTATNPIGHFAGGEYLE